MNFQLLRAVRETTRSGFNLTDVADELHTSQLGISRQIRELEDELGIEIFVRVGKRLTRLTPPGEAVMPLVERLLLNADNLRRVGEKFSTQNTGRLSIAATHSQARYALPTVVRDFRRIYPQVSLHLRKRKCIEQCFGWAKVVGRMRQVMVRGLDKVNQAFTLTMAAYNITRLRNLDALGA